VPFSGAFGVASDDEWLPGTRLRDPLCQSASATLLAVSFDGTGVAPHHDVGLAALLEIRIEDRFAGRAPARLGTLENPRFSTNSSEDVLF
jgi:hypothetical protein